MVLTWCACSMDDVINNISPWSEAWRHVHTHTCIFHSLAIQVPDVISHDTHVLPLSKTMSALAAEGTRGMETLLSSLTPGKKRRELSEYRVWNKGLFHFSKWLYTIHGDIALQSHAHACPSFMQHSTWPWLDIELTSSTFPVMNCLHVLQVTPKESW